MRFKMMVAIWSGMRGSLYSLFGYRKINKHILLSPSAKGTHGVGETSLTNPPSLTRDSKSLLEQKQELISMISHQAQIYLTDVCF